jgi:hypothetical protein
MLVAHIQHSKGESCWQLYEFHDLSKGLSPEKFLGSLKRISVVEVRKCEQVIN